MKGPSEINTQLNLIIPGNKSNIEKTKKAAHFWHIFGMVISYAFLVVAAIIVLFPFYYMVMASFMAEVDVDNGRLIPITGNFFENIVYNYTQTLSQFNYGRYVGNTLIVAITTTLLQVIVTILSAYAFARLEFRGRDILFTIFLATMMIPGEMMVLTNYITMSNLGLTGRDQTQIQAYLAMILPFISSVFYIFLLRQNFKQIPNELYLAARVDGKSDWQYLWKVMVPLATPTLITITILSIIGSWNAYVWPNIVTSTAANRENLWTISVAIRNVNLAVLEHEVWVPQDSWLMCASVLTVVPLLVLFIVFRKYIMSGTGRAGIKG
ncbi:MAG: carbohydrate ABC transporter permease [Bacilli bacterium]|nr:carbohydrate ABC transporter permease [Bacilli bacterium]